MFESLLLGFLFALFLFKLIFDQCAQSRLTKLSMAIPGMRKLPIIGCYGLPTDGRAQYQFRKTMIESYGHIYKYWVGNILTVVLTDPRDVEAVIGNMGVLDKGKTYDFLRPWLGSGLLTSGGIKWQMRRKAITPTFHFKILEHFIEIFNKNGLKLVSILKDKLDKDEFDALPYISNYTLDVICETAMGVEIHAQGQETSTYISTVKKMLDFIIKVKGQPWILRKLHFFLKLENERDRMLAVLHGFTNNVIKSKRKQGFITDKLLEGESETKKKTAFLELLLNLSEKPDSSIQSDEDIREEVDTFMFEGHDTTSSALCSTIMLLGMHPDIQSRVYSEISEVMSHSDYELSYKDLQGMKYTEMVLKEAMRLYPPVPSISRTLTKELQLPSGYILPANIMVNIDVYNLHRHKMFFSNPETFNPDNFLPQNSMKRHAFAFIPFSAGPRNCIGQKFAMSEMKTTIAKLIYNYEIIGGHGTIEPSLGVIFKSISGYHIKLKRR